MNIPKNKLIKSLQRGKGVFMLRTARYLKYSVILMVMINFFIMVPYIVYPRPYKESVITASETYQVDPLLIYAVMKTESKFNKNALSHKGAKGLMQIMDKTGQWGAELIGIEGYSHDKLFEADMNIQLGTWYIARLIKQYEGDLCTVLTAYNAGTGNVAKWRENKKYSQDGKTIHTIPFKETKDYVNKVSLYYKRYKRLYT